jgi:hypothetical protein
MGNQKKTDYVFVGLVIYCVLSRCINVHELRDKYVFLKISVRDRIQGRIQGGERPSKIEKNMIFFSSAQFFSVRPLT